MIPTLAHPGLYDVTRSAVLAEADASTTALVNKLDRDLPAVLEEAGRYAFVHGHPGTRAPLPLERALLREVLIPMYDTRTSRGLVVLLGHAVGCWVRAVMAENHAARVAIGPMTAATRRLDSSTRPLRRAKPNHHLGA